jgi:hypothetical protein
MVTLAVPEALTLEEAVTEGDDDSEGDTDAVMEPDAVSDAEAETDADKLCREGRGWRSRTGINAGIIARAPATGRRVRRLGGGPGRACDPPAEVFHTALRHSPLRTRLGGQPLMWVGPLTMDTEPEMDSDGDTEPEMDVDTEAEGETEEENEMLAEAVMDAVSDSLMLTEAEMLGLELVEALVLRLALMEADSLELGVVDWDGLTEEVRVLVGVRVGVAEEAGGASSRAQPPRMCSYDTCPPARSTPQS